MTREESIQFIDKCIEEIKNLPADKLDEYRRAYDLGTLENIDRRIEYESRS